MAFRRACVTLVLLALSMLSLAKRHALLIGINHYIHPGRNVDGAWRNEPVHDLDDGDNNATTMLHILQGLYGWDPKQDDIQILLSAEQVSDKSSWPNPDITPMEATSANILAALQKLENVEPGDTVVFYYSGHGSVVKNLGHTTKVFKSNAPNGQSYNVSNTIVPVDTLTVGADITNNEMDAIFNKILTKYSGDQKVHLTAIFDCCNSGEIWRGNNLAAVMKAVPPATSDHAVTEDDLPSGQTPLDNGGVFLTACKFDQNSLAIDDSRTGNMAQGALTFALAQFLESSPVDPDLDSLNLALATDVSDLSRNQTPSIDCKNMHLDIFGQASGSRAHEQIPVLEQKPDYVVLAGGTDLGLHKDTVLEGVAGNKTVQLTIANEPTLTRAYAAYPSEDASIIGQLKSVRVTQWTDGGTDETFCIPSDTPASISGKLTFLPEDGVEVSADRSKKFDYVLTSKGSGAQTLYAWVRAADTTAFAAGLSSQTEPLWVDLPDPTGIDTLKSVAKGLARLDRWLALSSHDATGASYELEVKSHNDGTVLRPGEALTVNQFYDYNLIVNGVPSEKKFVYLFQVYPDLHMQPILPRSSADDQKDTPRSKLLASVKPSNGGSRTVFLLISDEKIPLSLFSSAPLGAERGGENMLSKLLLTKHDRMRGEIPPVPQNWSITHISCNVKDNSGRIGSKN
ncbi:MAG TPA: caspase family protein [Fimbriimonadaceae bacterium]